MNMTSPQTRPFKIDGLPVFKGTQSSRSGGAAFAQPLTAAQQKQFFSPEAKTFKIDGLPQVGKPENGVVNRSLAALPRSAADKIESPDEILIRQAQTLVGQTFYGPMLKQMHNSPFKSDLFSGGRGEEAFAPMMDSILSERMSRSAANQLVQPIVKSLKRQAGKAYEKQQQKEAADVSADRRA
ncbi:MAG TPA: hypothetical protein VGB55_03635 [Tepidisphaeraceae bacterium]|jgi:hypothetical protein